MKKDKKTVLELLKEKTASQEFELPVSKLNVVMKFFSARQARLAQQQAVTDGKVDEDLMYASMIAETCTFNGEKLNPYDIMENLPGLDFMTLQGKLVGSDVLDKN